jgi:hypothetical protein
MSFSFTKGDLALDNLWHFLNTKSIYKKISSWFFTIESDVNSTFSLIKMYSVAFNIGVAANLFLISPTLQVMNVIPVVKDLLGPIKLAVATNLYAAAAAPIANYV